MSSAIEQQRFEALYNDTREDLTRYVKRRLSDQAAADDLVQEAFVRFKSAGYTVGSVEEPRSILFRIAHNLVVDRIRRQMRTQANGGDNTLNSVADPSPTPEQTASAREELKLVSAAIDGLKPACREVFLAHRLDGLKHREIAEKYGISRSMVEKHIAEAMFQITQAIRRL